MIRRDGTETIPPSLCPCRCCQSSDINSVMCSRYLCTWTVLCPFCVCHLFAAASRRCTFRVRGTGTSQSRGIIVTPKTTFTWASELKSYMHMQVSVCKQTGCLKLYLRHSLSLSDTRTLFASPCSLHRIIHLNVVCVCIMAQLLFAFRTHSGKWFTTQYIYIGDCTYIHIPTTLTAYGTQLFLRIWLIFLFLVFS